MFRVRYMPILSVFKLKTGIHRLKGPGYEAGTKLQAASGLHHLIGNHWHVLVRGTFGLSRSSLTPVQAETLDKKFEKPLRQHLDTYRAVVTVRVIVSRLSAIVVLSPFTGTFPCL